MVAEPDVLAWKLTMSPTATDRTPIAAAVAIIVGTRFTRRAAVSGPTRSPKTSRVPTV